MIIDCISDTHGFFPKLEGGDLLIVAGDLTASDKAHQLMEFGTWLTEQSYKKKVVIAGNHDNLVCNGRWKLCTPIEYGWDFDYLCDSGAEIQYIQSSEVYGNPFNPSGDQIKKLKIWGSPWTPWFKGINPSCKAFMVSEGKLEAKFAKIPDDTDILVTHGPPLGVFDGIVNNIPMKNGVMKEVVKHAGSRSLDDRVSDIKPRLHVFGHIHEGYGHDLIGDVEFVNCSYVNERYEPVNKPIRIVL